MCDDGIVRNFFVPNLVVLQREDGHEWVWEGESCMDGFCEFVFLSEISLATTAGKKTIIGHNASSFDSILVLKHLLTYLTEDPKLVFKNNTIYSMIVGNVCIRCSLLFFQCALAKLPKSFKITCAKGHFPHLFNNIRNRELDVMLQQRAGELASAGYKVEIMRECEWKEWKTDPVVSRQVEEISYLLPDERTSPICPRDALYGGRTEAFRLLYDNPNASLDGEHVKFRDFVSLYPGVMHGEVFPVGEPVAIQRPVDHSLYRFFGLIKAKVDPPRGLYHPVLPVLEGGKLKFALCRTRTKEGATRAPYCKHDKEQGALAIRKGYQISEIYWVLHYEYSSTSLYKLFVNKFMALKLTASGFPEGCNNDRSKQNYVDETKTCYTILFARVTRDSPTTFSLRHLSTAFKTLFSQNRILHKHV